MEVCDATYSYSDKLANFSVEAVVAAAGIGLRMGASIPKQYCKLDQLSILEHTINRLLDSPIISKVIVVLHPNDSFFAKTSLANLPKITTVTGGNERVDSVLAGLLAVSTPWVLVHDAARPFVPVADIHRLVFEVLQQQDLSNSSTTIEQQSFSSSTYVSNSDCNCCGGLLVTPATDTLKQGVISHKESLQQGSATLAKTIDRSFVYRALTPQFFQTLPLIQAIQQAQQSGFNITDEASAMEFVGKKVLMVLGSAINFKITEPSDLELAKAICIYQSLAQK